MHKSYFYSDEIKHATSTPKEKKVKEQKVEAKVELLVCTKCQYECKKETTLEKHMIAKHSDHQCK